MPRTWVLIVISLSSGLHLHICLPVCTYETGTNPALLALPALPALPGCPPHPMASVDVRSGS